MPTEDTIVAVATPPGRGGLGVVRISGDRALTIISDLIPLSTSPPDARRATLGEFVDPQSGHVLDQVVITCFHGPHSYTGEDVVEISCHGAPVVIQYLVECCLERGARPAEPGEFTMRAFLNGRMDLTQAEAVRDLIESRTLFQARAAAQQLQGAVSRRLQPAKKALVDLIARLEAGIDFAEDDLPVSSAEEIRSGLDRILTDLKTLATSYESGRVVREGLSVAIVGRPNVGKSSLFNRLLNQDRAIVTATPGTTRDVVSETASLGGIPLRLADTAGIRDTLDEAEVIGVQKSLETVADSDVRLLVVDASQEWSEEDGKLLEKLRPFGAMLVAFNKCDLPAAISREQVRRMFSGDRMSGEAGQEIPDTEGCPNIVWTSAINGEGVAELAEGILNMAMPDRDMGGGGEYLTNLRHQQLVKASITALQKARSALEVGTHHEMLLLDFYDALRALDSITGATTVDDVLGVIFSTFCVGK